MRKLQGLTLSNFYCCLVNVFLSVGESLKSAKVVLKQNGFNVYVFAAALRDTIIKGRHKNNNIMLVDSTNCGKSFLVNPLELIFKSFVNPENGTCLCWIRWMWKCLLKQFPLVTSADCMEWFSALTRTPNRPPNPSKECVCHRFSYYSWQHLVNICHRESPHWIHWEIQHLGWTRKWYDRDTVKSFYLY